MSTGTRHAVFAVEDQLASVVPSFRLLPPAPPALLGEVLPPDIDLIFPVRRQDCFNKTTDCIIEFFAGTYRLRLLPFRNQSMSQPV